MASQSWTRGRLIGTGSFGSVSLATDKSTNHTFAVKSVNSNSPPVSILSLEKEIEILKSVNSPFVVSYLGDDTSNEGYFGNFRNLHMEFVRGGTVAELAAKRGGLEEKETRGYARCLTRALQYLHTELEIIHCDVKGRNLLAGSGPNGAKLSDFGSAMRVADVAKGSNLIGGTPFWMAPELARGEKPSCASDVWALACTVIEMASGSHPWPEFKPVKSDIAGLMFRIGFDGILPKYPVKLSNDGKDFLDKCLRIDPSERWSCEKLMSHPFVADVADEDWMEHSPRCVLDWDCQESEDESEKFADNFDFCCDDLGEKEIINFAKARVSELDSGEEKELEWDSEGWETVRWDPHCQKGTDTQILDFTRAEVEMCPTGGDEPSGSDQMLPSLNPCDESCNGSYCDCEMTRYREGDRVEGMGEGEASGGGCNSNYGGRFNDGLKDGFECQSPVWTVGFRICFWRFLLLVFYHLLIHWCGNLLLFELKTIGNNKVGSSIFLPSVSVCTSLYFVWVGFVDDGFIWSGLISRALHLFVGLNGKSV